MLDDRPYMRSASFRSQRPVTFTLMIVNTVIFVVQSLLQVWNKPFFAWYWNRSALSIAGLKKGYFWELITYQFMHAGLWHLLANLLVIYFFGRAIEETLGRRGFLKVYFSSGIVGGLFQLAYAAVSHYFGGAEDGVVGASACAFGLVAAFATMFPENLLTLLLFFVIPVSMRARTLLWISIAIAVFGIVAPIDNVANAAHLGGILTGVVYIKWIVQSDRTFVWPSFRLPRRRDRELNSILYPKRPFWQQPKPPQDLDPESAEFISREVDPILDKISAHGIHSLTERERRILEAARARMAKR